MWCYRDVGQNLFVSHRGVADSETHAHDLLQLKLDRGLDLLDLGGNVVSVRQRRGELARAHEAGSHELGNLLDQVGRRQKRVVLLGCAREEKR